MMAQGILEVVETLLLGSVGGLLGQGVRAVFGLAKAQRRANEQYLPLSFWFDPKRLVLSLSVGALSGAISALIVLGYPADASLPIGVLVALFVLAGYAGTDVLEAARL